MALDPHVAALAARYADTPRPTTWDAEALRRGFAASVAELLGPPTPVAAIEPLTLTTAAEPIAARLYHPGDGDALRAGIVFFHGGGFVVGDLDTYDGICRALARRTSAIVIAV